VESEGWCHRGVSVHGDGGLVVAMNSKIIVSNQNKNPKRKHIDSPRDVVNISWAIFGCPSSYGPVWHLYLWITIIHWVAIGVKTTWRQCLLGSLLVVVVVVT
jgi:hypothetical protein